MIAPTLSVRRSAIDGDRAGKGRQLGSGELVVDTPPGIVVECLATVRPPRVRAIDRAGEVTADVDPAELVAHPIEVRALLGQEPGVLQVAFPVLDVKLGVTDVEVADDERIVAALTQLDQSICHRLQKPVRGTMMRSSLASPRRA